MELTKEALDNVRFRTKGLWYNAQQVDTFLEQLTAAVEQEELLREERQAEASALRERVEEQLAEIAALKAQLEEARQSIETALQETENTKAALAEETAKVAELQTEEHVRERETLLQDVKALRALRDRFRAAMEQDLTDFTEKLRNLTSAGML